MKSLVFTTHKTFHFYNKSLQIVNDIIKQHKPSSIPRAMIWFHQIEPAPLDKLLPLLETLNLLHSIFPVPREGV